MSSDPIQKLILKNKNNFRIAAAIGEAWPEIRAQIVEEFFKRLETRMKPRLKGWTFGSEERFGIDPYPSFHFLKPPWRDQYGLCLQPGDYGRRVVMGIYRETNTIGRRAFAPELLEAVSKRFPLAKERRPWWEALIPMQSPSADWRQIHVLWQLKSDAKVCSDVTDQLLDLAEVSAPILDRIVRKYRK